jgi:hypothetical protein
MTDVDLLDLFHHRTTHDRGRSGLRGLLCVAIARPEGIRRWVAHCAPEGDSFRFVDAIPPDCDAVLVAAESDLQVALRGNAFAPDARVVVRGDAAFLEAFCRRYFEPVSAVSLRASLLGAR